MADLQYVYSFQFELDADKGLAVLYVNSRENFDKILDVS